MSRLVPDRVAVAPGDGVVVRRSDAVLFLTDPAAPAALELLDAFGGADSSAAAIEAVLTAVESALDTGTGASPLAIVSWADGGGAAPAEVRTIVCGAVELRSDLASLPMISGAGSATWVERRVAGPPERWSVRVGAEASDDTDLSLGRVRSGGVLVTFGATVGRSPLPPPSAGDPTPIAPSAPGRVAAPAPAPASPRRPDVAAVLDVAGEDWMEDSLGLAATDDEVTLTPDDLDAPVWPDAGPSTDVGAEQAVDRPAEPPVSPPDEPLAEQAVRRARVGARHCAEGHPNPPERLDCARCGDTIGVDAPEQSIEQPVLGRLRLPDGSRYEIDGTLVVGRAPSAATAGVTGDEIVLDGPTSISRTHLVVRADGWTITVTDCGSRSGTAVASGVGDPVTLEPWVAHETPVGARIFVGGPTVLDVEPGHGAPAGGDEYWYG